MERISRRRLLGLGLVAVPAAVLLEACGSGGSDATQSTGGRSQSARPPTPACADDDVDATATLEETEGPFFSSGSPERTSLRVDGIDGTPFVVSGAVLSTDCRPLAGAKLDFWHADDDGEYDNDGYRLRGHQFTDAQGGYRLETIEPGLYTGRTRHIHVKVQGQDTPVLTTQMYFPGEAQNDSDSLFDASLLMNVTDAAEGRNGSFDFVLS